MFADEIQVTFYADIVAAILSVGVLVLCSRGIIRDRFEAQIFRAILLAVTVLTAFDAVIHAIRDFDFGDKPIVMTLLMTVWALLMLVSVCLGLVYANYRFYRSKDSIRRSFWKYLIPLYAAMVVTIGNIFFGYLFYYGLDGKIHVTGGAVPLYALVFVYLFAFVIWFFIHQKTHRNLLFFDVWSFVTPIIFGVILSLTTPYSTVPLGLAISLTYVYAGIVNEKSFQDRTTGYLNRYYMRYLKGEIEKGDFKCRSAMVYRIGNVGDMERFAEMLSPILPKKCIVVRYSEDTVIMFTEVTEKIALRMMEEDVEAGLKKLNADKEADEVSVTVKSMVMKRKETPFDFYLRFLQKVG